MQEVGAKLDGMQTKVIDEVVLSPTLTLVFDDLAKTYVPKPKAEAAAPPLTVLPDDNELETVRIEREVFTDGATHFARQKEFLEKPATPEVKDLQAEVLRSKILLQKNLQLLISVSGLSAIGGTIYLTVVTVRAMAATFARTVAPALNEGIAFSLKTLATLAILGIGVPVVMWFIFSMIKSISLSREVMPENGYTGSGNEGGATSATGGQIINMNFNGVAGQTNFNTGAQEYLNR